MKLFTIIKRLVLLTPLVVGSLLFQFSTLLQAQAPFPCSSSNGAPCQVAVTKLAPIAEGVSSMPRDSGINLSNMSVTNHLVTVGTIGPSNNLEIVLVLIDRTDGTVVTIVGDPSAVTVSTIAIPIKQSKVYLRLIQR